MRVTATQAKNRFGAICTQAKTEPVFVEKDGESTPSSCRQTSSTRSMRAPRGSP